MSRILSTTLLAATLAAPPLLAQDTATEADHRAFEEKLEGARLIGYFTVDTGQTDQAPRTDSYSVSELERGEGDAWIFNYSMSYGEGQAMTVPIPVRVVWAGDTPVLTMTEQAVEGLGVFSVRVLIYGDRYAGTWQHGAFGGHMWGRIEAGAAIDESAEAGASESGAGAHR